MTLTPAQLQATLAELEELRDTVNRLDKLFQYGLPDHMELWTAAAELGDLDTESISSRLRQYAHQITPEDWVPAAMRKHEEEAFAEIRAQGSEL